MAGAAPWRPGDRAPRPWRRARFGLEVQQRLAATAAPVLLVVFFGLYIVGDHPFAVVAVNKAAATESGSLLNRTLIFGILGLVLPLMLVRFRDVVSLLAANWVGWLIVIWSLASFLWASHPDLTIRRGVAFGIVYLNLAILVATTSSTSAVFRSLVVVVTALTLLNIFVMVAMPAVSHSPIGEKGIFDAKNTAGTLGMLTVVTMGVSLFLFRAWLARASLAAVYLLSWVFLVATKSKTSLGVAAIMTAAGPLLYTLLSRGGALRFLALLAAIAGGFGLVVAGSALGVTSDDLMLLLFGDLTFTQRTPIWADVVRSIADQLWLGYGFGSFWDVGAMLNPLKYAPWDAFYMDAQVINTAHNGYLDQLLQTGVVGFSLGVLAIVRCVAALWSAAVRTRDEEERLALLGLTCRDRRKSGGQAAMVAGGC